MYKNTDGYRIGRTAKHRGMSLEQALEGVKPAYIPAITAGYNSARVVKNGMHPLHVPMLGYKQFQPPKNGRTIT